MWSQILTIVAVILGSTTTYLAEAINERSKLRAKLAVRWDGHKLDVYSEYVGAVRGCIYAAVLLYEAREGIRPSDKTQAELTYDLFQSEGRRALAFERVMLLAGDAVIDAAHDVNKAALRVDWAARGAEETTLQEWRERNADAFAAINGFHQAARNDLGVSGAFDGEEHSARGLNLPSQTTPDEA